MSILMQGNCLERMSEIPVNSVNMILADPPFGTTKCRWDIVIPFVPMWKCVNRVSKDNAAIALMAQTPFDKLLGCSNLEMLRYEWIWEKPNATGFLNAKRMPLKAHENILMFYKKLPMYNPIMTHGHERKTATKREVDSECYGKAIKTTVYDSTSRYPRSVQKVSSDKQRVRKLHSTQKPVELMKYLIETYTNPGDTVLDFCMGSGTTGVACKITGRKFIGIEKDLEIFEIAKNRIESQLL